MKIDKYLLWLENKADLAQTLVSNRSELNKSFFVGIALAGFGLLLSAPVLQGAAAMMLIGPTAACGLSQAVKSSSKFLRKLVAG